LQQNEDMNIKSKINVYISDTIPIVNIKHLAIQLPMLPHS